MSTAVAVHSRATYDCPTWCVVPLEHHADDDPGRALHRGGLFGAFEFSQLGGDSTTANVIHSMMEADYSAAGLRQLAADALAAAEWLAERAESAESMRIACKPEVIKGHCQCDPSPLFIASLMDVTGLPFEDLFEIVREQAPA